MAKRAILYIDLLGVQKMWVHGGADAVRNRLSEFSDFIKEQTCCLPAPLHRGGEYTAILSGDSISIPCQDFDQAIGLGVHFFTQAFYNSDRVSSPLWLRGAISRWSNQYLPVNTDPITAKGIQVGTQYIMEDD